MTTTTIIIYKSLVLDYSWVSNRLNWDRMKIISNQDAELNFFFRFGDHWLGCYPPSALSYKATSSSWTYYCRWPELAMQLTLKKIIIWKTKNKKKVRIDITIIQNLKKQSIYIYTFLSLEIAIFLYFLLNHCLRILLKIPNAHPIVNIKSL